MVNARITDMEVSRSWRHTGVLMEIKAHDSKDHIASHKYNVYSVCILFILVLHIRVGSIYKMIPLIIPTNVFPLSVHHQESSYL